jgi:hypothetical protein
MKVNREYDRDADKAMQALLNELSWLLPIGADQYVKLLPEKVPYELVPELEGVGGMGGGGYVVITDVLIPLLKDGAVVAAVIAGIVAIVSKIIDRWKDAEVTIEYGDRKLHVKGQQMQDVKALIQQVFPELDAPGIEPAPSRLDTYRARLTAWREDVTANPAKYRG